MTPGKGGTEMTTKGELQMSKQWAERQRRTNRLTRAMAAHLFRQDRIEPDQLFGLCKLTWITKSFDDNHASYIRTTKIPALGLIARRDYTNASLDEVAEDLTQVYGSDAIGELALSHTGFTNFYGAYRNSAQEWLHDNFDVISPLFRDAYRLKSDKRGFDLARRIESLPRIPRAGHGGSPMRPEYLLTPAFFALDRRIRFPLINGNEGVQRLLSKLKVNHASLSYQYQSMISLYGTGGIEDAADLDQPGRHLADFVPDNDSKSRKKLLVTKPTDSNRELPLKDETDIVILQEARTVKCKRIHNAVTNHLKEAHSGYTLLEGDDQEAAFDVLVKDYPAKGDDLLIEVKVSDEAPHMRMAIGQLFDYWHSVKGDAEPRMAILIPEPPTKRTKQLLDWLGIGLLWFSGKKLDTCSSWLRSLADGK